MSKWRESIAPLTLLALLAFLMACQVGPTQTPTLPISTFHTVSTPSPPTLSPVQPTRAPTLFVPTTSTVDTVNVPQLTISAVYRDIPAYDRGEWRHWIDEDRDCQNTRAEVLIEESLVSVDFRNANECTVDSGQWLAPYTGFLVESAGDLDVDHMVPLANAHRSGGWAWSPERKRAYANDLSFEGHLIAVTASANRSKGAKGPEGWQPTDSRHLCDYAVNWITVKAVWGLTATTAEWAALEDMLSTCSEKVEFGPGESPPTNQPVMPKAVATREPRMAEVPRYDPLGTDRNCSDFDTWIQAQNFYVAAGGPATDRHRLDGDRDGIACESLTGAP